MTTPDGKVVKSRTQDLTYRYDPSGTKLGKVTMIVSYLGKEQTLVFDFQNQEQVGQLSYTGTTGTNNFTFLVEFLGDDLSRIQNVQLTSVYSEIARIRSQPFLTRPAATGSPLPPTRGIITCR